MTDMREPDSFTYRYYAIADITPIRVLIDSAGRRRGAEVPNPETGQLYKKTTMLGRILASEEVEEIDQATFERMCQSLYSRRKDAPAPGR